MKKPANLEPAVPTWTCVGCGASIRAHEVGALAPATGILRAVCHRCIERSTNRKRGTP